MKDPVEREFLELRFLLGDLFLKLCYALGIDKLVRWLDKLLKNLSR